MIDAPLLERVLATLAALAAQPDETVLGRLRQDFDGVHFSLCRDDDVPARVACAAANAVCRLYYVASGEHCLSLTGDAAAASGLLVAWLTEDEE